METNNSIKGLKKAARLTFLVLFPLFANPELFLGIELDFNFTDLFLGLKVNICLKIFIRKYVLRQC